MFDRDFLQDRKRFLQAMRDLVAVSVAATQNVCDRDQHYARSSVDSTFRSNLRMAWHDHIAPLVPKQGSISVYEVPVAALGRIHGALYVHLDAIYKRWKTFDGADETLFNQSEMSKQAAVDAAAAGAKYLGLAYDLFDGLHKEYAKNAKIARQLAADIFAHAKKNGQEARLSRPLKSMYVAKATWNRVEIRAEVHSEVRPDSGDGFEPCGLALEQVFSTQQDCEELLALVRQAFGKNAKLEKPKIETCDIGEAFIRPVILTEPWIGPLQIILPDPDCCKIGNLS
jgi:hypothetical protein